MSLEYRIGDVFERLAESSEMCSRYPLEGYGKSVLDCPTRCQESCIGVVARPEAEDER